MSSAQNSKNVQYRVSVPKLAITFLTNAKNGRDARSKVLKQFRSTFSTKLKRDDLKSQRVAITNTSPRGKVKV